MQAKTSQMIPVLTIAGSDCSGGAGIQADLKTFSAHKLFGMSVVLSVVAENTARVISVHNIPVENVDEQMQAVFEDIVPKATKIGMIGSKELMSCVAANLQKFQPKNVVIDPVMFAKNGFALMPVEDCEFFKNTIVQFADILTPNIAEAEFLCGFKIQNEEDMIRSAKVLFEQGAKNVLVKGGHSKNSANDVFFDGKEIVVFEGLKIDTKNTHGTGCTLSSAIASNLALAYGMRESVQKAKDYVFGAILHSLNLGKGCGPTNHFFELMEK
ncbi:bifunctional hydroxymethylpyrimidine kinase/phosphomethylpyrimidine kinase [Campylobacter sp. MIT 21-1685]|uniref:bifunctional hydroxymethylpyrimidine kinase/phosphomethylpyrimidine kinase n=1 Tax=unclassified Campylobacter TaxID=2593542 RepID=UPI00224AA4FD|nr:MULTISPECIES: bifunctional hydroxymethylpyrimidine kinase/phosphomethylpyrimidine kinase [unclassified Campylobacter]MCX2682398.1 bifunctional hydroxymethylpyrimidine kinase/phosphomethylpyrimidine kinase [Campylobacter sp. MIT 21-1684]MCX2750678.1 bifunctional hydroxymethylpyrimidine kinase/phosphomethylpyrimidine kinase [Campylobacter sp. MIT 21-1682]MCX2806774.1 bifunctional hydroxymethylpyrimidine kinase/phosphomethylpyrimidine kinase [Campylobacter sp. MIT 21-1685]